MSLSDLIKSSYNVYHTDWKCRPEVLLCANTVKPMHGVVPREILGKEWWDKTRMESYRSTNYHCIACGVYRSQAKEYSLLEGHELYRINYLRGRQTYLETIPLCHYCHSFIHDSRLLMLLREGKVTKLTYDSIMEHGDQVLSDAGLIKNRPRKVKMARWEEWRLILFGKEYPPIYKNYTEWCDHFKV